MQLPTRTTPITRCETASAFTQGALRRYSDIFTAADEVSAQLESLAETLEGATAALIEAQASYRAKVVGLVALRFEVKLMDLRADDMVRTVKRAADNHSRAVSAAVFPKGITPIVKPIGQTQVDKLRDLEGRIAAASKWAERQQALDQVVAVRERYETALTQRKEGMIAAAAERALRDAAKEDFLDTFAVLAGAVRQIFPRDRVRQDVFFDTLRSRSTPQNPDTTDSDEPDEPADE